ncbi:hypothetical protein BB14905_01970 [Bacillus sp. B14905]|nr:hypothetical protein BB14905_01970 [Bacillus sp. B14905]
MSDERIITAAVITTGEKSDGKYLQEFIEKSTQAGMKINKVIGDAAYSEKANIEYTKEEKIALVAKLNPILTQGPRKEEDKFEFNKEAGMFVRPVISRQEKPVRVKKERVRVKVRHIILTLKDAEYI